MSLGGMATSLGALATWMASCVWRRAPAPSRRGVREAMASVRSTRAVGSQAAALHAGAVLGSCGGVASPRPGSLVVWLHSLSVPPETRDCCPCTRTVPDVSGLPTKSCFPRRCRETPVSPVRAACIGVSFTAWVVCMSGLLCLEAPALVLGGFLGSLRVSGVVSSPWTRRVCHGIVCRGTLWGQWWRGLRSLRQIPIFWCIWQSV